MVIFLLSFGFLLCIAIGYLITYNPLHNNDTNLSKRVRETMDKLERKK